jgi:hypothetical protein
VVALSTLEAEFIACSDATREAIWLRQVDKDIRFSMTPTAECHKIPIACNNQGAINLIKTGITKQKTKHVDVKYHHSHNEQNQGRVIFHYVPTGANVADLLTKLLLAPQHQQLTRLASFW